MVVGGGEVSVVDRTVTIVHRGEGRVGIRGVVERTLRGGLTFFDFKREDIHSNN